MSRRRQLLAILLGLALAAALPALAPSNYAVDIGINACMFTVAAMALNLVYGYAGLLSFAQLAFWGIGGYAAAIAVTDGHLSFWLGLALATLVNLLLGYAVGFVALRLNRHAFVIVTLAFALLTWLLARDWTGVTRGPLGIPGLEPPPGFHGARAFYYLALGFAVLALGLIYLIASSRIGMTLKAIRQNEPLAQAQGIAVMRYKLFAFAAGAAITGAAGGIYVFHLSIVDPLIMDFYYMQTFLIMVIIGGAGSFWGVALAGIAMAIVPELLRFSNELRMVMYGAVLIAVVALMPRGIAGWLERRRPEAA